MQLKVLSSALSLSVLMVSCGGNSGGPSGVRPDVYQGTPIKITKQSERCLRAFSTDDEIKFNIQQFISGNSLTRFIDFSDQVKNNYVESRGSRPIEKSKYGLQKSTNIVFTYDSIEGGYIPEGSEETAQEAMNLTVCPSAQSYSSYTYENIGLNISNSISKTYKEVSKTLGENALKPVSVSVAPMEKMKYSAVGGPNDGEVYAAYSTDNAYFDPSQDSITFLPQSIEQKEFMPTPLWEIPMVASHEYGHHIFNSLVNSKISSVTVAMKSCFGHRTHALSSNQEESGETRDNGHEFARGSINEGFADLISYYTLGNQERSLKKVQCFENIRDVGSSFFSSGHNKEFSTKAVRLLNSSTSETPDSNCATPDFQEIHDVGAIFAYGMDQLFSKVTDDKGLKLKMLLNWAKELAKKHSSISSEKAANYIFASMELAYKIAIEETGRAVNSNDCNIMDSIFTGSNTIECRYLK